MASITLRSVKGSPLTITEMDDNFSNVNIELGQKLITPTSTGLVSATNLSGATSGRSIAVSGVGLSVTNANGVSGNPTIISNATNTNTVSTLVARDASGNFSAGTITATLTGNVTGDVTGNVSGTANTITSTLPISLGGTGATSTTSALDNLLPSGEVAGYILKTSGAGSYFWGAQTGNVTTAGTRVDSTRTITTATSSQTLFTAPTYVPGANQLRVYIDGVRQFDSEYTETSTTSFTLDVGVTAGAVVLAEVDGYIEYDMAASEVTYSPTGTMTSTNVQDALDELHADTNSLGTISSQDSTSVNITGGTVTGLTTFGIGANWTAVQTGTDLIFKYNGVNKMKITSGGNLVVTGNVTAYGTV